MLAQLAGYTLEPILLGESGANVRRCTHAHSPARILKSAPLGAELRLDGEAVRLRWLSEHGAPVPAVCEYDCIDGIEYLLLAELPGTEASNAEWISRAPRVAAAIGRALAQLHLVSAADCPFDERIGVRIEEARRRVIANLVDESDFDDVRAGRSATEILAELVATTPPREDLVITHGDFSLPNIIIHEIDNGEVEVSGFVDCGRAGVADRYQDLALVARDISGICGGTCVAPFLEAYGLRELRDDKLAFYTHLDEFF